MSHSLASPEEIELKLALGTGAPARLLALPLFAKQTPITLVMRNRYFDTPDRALESSRVALRLREFNDTIIQTVKTAGHGSGGLHRRGEWEWPRDEATLETTVLNTLSHAMAQTNPDLRCLGNAEVISRLIPVYATDFTRRAWVLTKNGSVIEVGLDEGYIDVEHARIPIFELELELKQGQADALWQLAEEIAAQVPLRPANASKAQRAVALRERAKASVVMPRTNTSASTFDSAIALLDQATDGLVDTETAKAHALQALDTLMQQVPEGLRDNAKAIADHIRHASRLEGADWIDAAFGQHCLRLLRHLHT